MPSECTSLNEVWKERQWVIQGNIMQIAEAIDKIYRIRSIYNSIIIKLWIPWPIWQSSEKACGSNHEPKWLVQIAVMLQELNELLKDSVHDLWYIEDNL